MAYTAQQIKDFVKAKGIGNNPNALQAFKDQYKLSDAEVDAALGAGASQKIKEGSAYRGDRQRSTSASDADVARTLSGGFDIDASDPYKLFQAAKLQGWSPEQAARASGRSVDEVQEFLQREGLSLDAPRGVSPSNPSNVRTNERTRSDNLPLPGGIEAQIKALWGNYGDWNSADQDQVAALARLFQANGISDLSGLNFKAQNTTRPSYMQETESGQQEMPGATFTTYDAFLGDRKLNFLGDVNRDGSLRVGPRNDNSTYENMGSLGGDLLGWSAQGGGNTSFQVVMGPNGEPVVVPTWGSSKQNTYDDIRGIGTIAAIAAGGYMAAGGAGAGGAAAGAGAGAGAGAAEQIAFLAANGMSDAAIAASFPELAAAGGLTGVGGGAAATIAATQGTTTSKVMEAAQALATKTGEALPSVLAKMAADPNVWKAGVALVGGALANKDGGTGAPGDLAASNMSPQQILQMIQATSNQNFDKSLNASRYNVNTPDGSSSWSQDPTTGQWTNTSTLSAPNQAIKDSRTNFAGQLSQWLPNAAGQYGATAMAGANRSGIPQYQFDVGPTPQLQAPQQQRVTPGQMQNNVQTTAQDWAGKVQAPVANWAQKSANADPWAFDQQASDAMYRANTRYLEPQQQKAQQGLEARLGEQGFVPGTPGYDRAMREMMDSNNQALAQARDTSILAGRQYGDQAFDNSQQGLQQGIAGMLSLAGTGINSDANRFSQNLAQGNFRNTAQQQNFGQQVTQAGLQRQAGLDRNATAQQQFDMNLGAGNFRNNAITGANNTANQNFQTDLGAQRNATLDAANWLNGYNPQAPGAAQSNVPGMANPDIASILQQYFNNNVSLQNASTASSNANTAAWGQLLSSIIPSLVNGGKP